MPNLEAHTDNAAPVIFGVTAIIYSAFEAQMIVIFLCAVLGAGIGLAFRPAGMPTTSKLDLALRFAGHTGYILITAVMTCFASYWIKKYFNGAEYPLAFFVSVALMIYRERMINGIGKILDRKMDAQ